MSSMFSPGFFPSILTISSGIFSGFSLGISTVSVAGILASSDPLPAWQQTYNKGKRFASMIMIITASGLKCYYDSKSSADGADARFLLVSLLAFSVAPYTLLIMKPVNDSLFAIKNEDKAKVDGRIRKTIEKWSNMQWGRTLLSTAAFIAAVWITVGK